MSNDARAEVVTDQVAPKRPPLDLSKRMNLRAEMARSGITFEQLQPWWSPDTDSFVNPMNDRETQQEIRSFMSRLWKAASDE